MDARPSPGARTVHLVLPATGRPLCGYEEESSRPSQSDQTIACSECSALLRSGLVTRRSILAR